MHLTQYITKFCYKNLKRSDSHIVIRNGKVVWMWVILLIFLLELEMSGVAIQGIHQEISRVAVRGIHQNSENGCLQ